jgi:hypothetical protein
MSGSSNNYLEIVKKINTGDCAKIIKLMKAIHDSFDKILQARGISDTAQGGTLASLEKQINLHSLLARLSQDGKPIDKDKLSNILIKNLNSQEVSEHSGILAWVAIAEQPLKLIEVVNPLHDLFSKWKKHTSTGSSKKQNEKNQYKAFLLKLNLNNEIRNKINSDNKFSTSSSILSNLKKKFTENANQWMLNKSKSNFDPKNDHIVFQTIAERSDILFKEGQEENPVFPDGVRYDLFMRGKEIIVVDDKQKRHELEESNKKDKKPIDYVSSSQIFFIPNNTNVYSTRDNILKDANNSLVYFEGKDPLTRYINREQNMQALESKFFQAVTRIPYDTLGDPEAQGYTEGYSKGPGNKGFIPTPMIIDGEEKSLICPLCTREIKTTKTESSAAKWVKKGFKRQDYDVDHLLNLIFNHLFDLNTRGNGIGFTNTCGDCNRQFKGEKIWCPSYKLWMDLVEKGFTSETEQQQYKWPGLGLCGINNNKKKIMPFDGYRSFTIDTIRTTGTGIVPNRDLKYSKGLMWKDSKDPRNKYDKKNKLTNANYIDVEEIFLDRIHKLIKLDENNNDTLVYEILEKNLDDATNVIAQKYIKFYENFGILEKVSHALQAMSKEVGVDDIALDYAVDKLKDGEKKNSRDPLQRMRRDAIAYGAKLNGNETVQQLGIILMKAREDFAKNIEVKKKKRKVSNVKSSLRNMDESCVQNTMNPLSRQEFQEMNGKLIKYKQQIGRMPKQLYNMERQVKDKIRNWAKKFVDDNVDPGNEDDKTRWRLFFCDKEQGETDENSKISIQLEVDYKVAAKILEKHNNNKKSLEYQREVQPRYQKIALNTSRLNMNQNLRYYYRKMKDYINEAESTRDSMSQASIKSGLGGLKMGEPCIDDDFCEGELVCNKGKCDNPPNDLKRSKSAIQMPPPSNIKTPGAPSSSSFSKLPPHSPITTDNNPRNPKRPKRGGKTKKNKRRKRRTRNKRKRKRTKKKIRRKKRTRNKRN